MMPVLSTESETALSDVSIDIEDLPKSGPIRTQSYGLDEALAVIDNPKEKMDTILASVRCTHSSSLPHVRLRRGLIAVTSCRRAPPKLSSQQPKETVLAWRSDSMQSAPQSAEVPATAVGRAVHFAQKGIAADSEGRLDEAFQFYMASLDNFQAAIQKSDKGRVSTKDCSPHLTAQASVGMHCGSYNIH